MRRDSILIVDDSQMDRELLSELFKDDFNILHAATGKETLLLLEVHHEEIAAVLLDIVLGADSGLDIMKQIKARTWFAQLPVIVISSENDKDMVREAYELGATDVIRKPYDLYIVKKRIENIAQLYVHKSELETVLTKQTDYMDTQDRVIREMNSKLIATLSTVVEFRNLESSEHINRVKLFTKALLAQMEQQDPQFQYSRRQMEQIVSASVLHDIGKIAIPDHVLLKPARLTEEEFEIIKGHTTSGCKIIEMLDTLQGDEFYRCCYEICRYHHERYDGKGYPDGLVGDQIPLSAQVVSVADVYDALVSRRVYKEAIDLSVAHEMIKSGECGVFSPSIMMAFDSCKEEFERIALHHNP